MAYVTSSQLYNWKFTPDELLSQRQECNSVARRRLASDNNTKLGVSDVTEVECLSHEDELNIVKRYILIMKALFKTFKDPELPADVFGFAACYFKRFYLSNSVMDFFPREMMLTSLYIACKAADFPLGLQMFTSHIPRNRERYSDFIVNSELFLMESLHYDLWIHTPYRPLCGLLIDLLAYRSKSSKPADPKDYSSPSLTAESLPDFISLRNDGYELIHTWHQTDLCLTVPPSQFALAVLVELGKRHSNLNVEQFIRDELCGCNPLNDAISDNGDANKHMDVGGGGLTQPTPEQLWMNLSECLSQIQTTVSEFDFIIDLSRFSEEETLLEGCRNPLYDPLSEEYAAAKERANSLMAILD